MLNLALMISFCILALAFAINAACFLARRDLPERVLALDTLYINAVALIVVYGIWNRTDDRFEAAILIAVLGFISTVALCKYLLRGDLIE